jgi:hypothetical protein
VPYSDEQGIEKSSLVERARSLSPIQKTGQRELDKGEFRDVPDRFNLDALVSIATRTRAIPDLMHGKLGRFSLHTLINLADRAGLPVALRIGNDEVVA